MCKPFAIPVLIFLISSINTVSNAQNIGINSSGALPNAKAILDVNSTDKGLLIPRIKLVNNDDPIKGEKPVGLMIWNDTTTAERANGFYFWNGQKWQSFAYNAGDAISIDTSNTIKVQPNSVTQNGYVPAPTESNKNAFYQTDSNGNPKWRRPNLTMYYINKF